MTSVSIEKAELKTALAAVKHACWKNELRRNLQGVHLALNGSAQFTTTDGHRLARYMASIKGGDSETEIMIPPDQFKRLAELCTGKGSVSIVVSDGHLTAEADTGAVSFEGHGGKFPNVEQVIPQSFDHSVEFPPLHFRTALKIAIVIGSEKIRPCALSFTPGLCCIVSEKSEHGETEYDIPCDFGESYEIGFNARYLMDSLQAIKPKSALRFQFNGPLNPALFTSAEMPEFFSLVMPLRIEW